MDTALALADWDGFAHGARRPRARGKRRGIALANYVEITTGAPREWSKVTVAPEGRVEVAIGTLSSGQGHAPASRNASRNGSACRSIAST